MKQGIISTLRATTGHTSAELVLTSSMGNRPSYLLHNISVVIPTISFILLSPIRNKNKYNKTHLHTQAEKLKKSTGKIYIIC